MKERFLLIIIQVVIGLFLGLGLNGLGVGGGSWLLSGILSGTLIFNFYRKFNDAEVKPNPNARKVGQILVGLSIGFSLEHSYIVELSKQLPLLVLLAIFLIICGGLIGYLYAYLEKTDILTGMLATVPGNIGVMASIAADYGGNIALVSLIQLIRFTTVILVIPALVKIPNETNLQVILTQISQFNLTPIHLSLLITLLVVNLVSVYVGNKLKIPAAPLFCSILTGLVFVAIINTTSWSELDSFNLPPAINVLGQILLGITIGEYWALYSNFKVRTFLYSIVPISLTFLAAIGAAVIAKILTDWDWLTCLLVTAPGGSPEMILIAANLTNHLDIVTLGHLTRLLVINLSLPLLIKFLASSKKEIKSNTLLIKGEGS